jgi:hypothetical protein
MTAKRSIEAAMTALIIDAWHKTRLEALRALAEDNPVDMKTLTAQLETPEGKARHMEHMSGQTLAIPAAFLVTFSIETGHPCGTCRHMSMSVQTEGRLPNEYAVWMVAELLGFTGDISECVGWIENGRKAAYASVD